MINMKELSLREIQLAELNILKKIDNICSKENITYFLFWGTLIGAIRHNGFIPWDDDVDIALPRDGYNKLLNYLKNNKQDIYPLELRHYSVTKNYIYPIARLVDTSYKVEYFNVEDYGLGLFVDLYPLDGWGNTDKDARSIANEFKLNQTLITLSGYKHFLPSSKNYLRTLPKYLLYLFAKHKGPNYFIGKADNMAQNNKYEDCKFVGCTSWEAYPQYRIDKKDLVPIKHKFEDGYYNIPQGYDRILRNAYGNYMEFPPIEEQNPHHNYKAYKI